MPPSSTSPSQKFPTFLARLIIISTLVVLQLVNSYQPIIPPSIRTVTNSLSSQSARVQPWSERVSHFYLPFHQSNLLTRLNVDRKNDNYNIDEVSVLFEGRRFNELTGDYNLDSNEDDEGDNEEENDELFDD